MLDGVDRIVPGLKKAATFAELGTPLTNVHYVAATEGNLYGTEKSLFHVGPFAWPIKTTIKGLYLCGASTLSHGVMGATFSGLVAAKTILKTSVESLLQQKGGGEILCLPSEHPETWPEHLKPRALKQQAPSLAATAKPDPKLDDASPEAFAAMAQEQARATL